MIEDLTARDILQRALRDPPARSHEGLLARWIQSRTRPEQLIEFVEVGTEMLPSATGTNWRTELLKRVLRSGRVWSMELIERMARCSALDVDALLANQRLLASVGDQLMERVVQEIEQEEYAWGNWPTPVLLHELLRRGWPLSTEQRVRLVEKVEDSPHPTEWLEEEERKGLLERADLPTTLRRRLQGETLEEELPGFRRDEVREVLLADPDLPPRLRIELIEGLTQPAPVYWKDACLHPDSPPSLIARALEELLREDTPYTDRKLHARIKVLKLLCPDLPDAARKLIYKQGRAYDLRLLVHAGGAEHVRETMRVLIRRFPDSTARWLRDGAPVQQEGIEPVGWKEKLAPKDLEPLLSATAQKTREIAMRLTGELDGPEKQPGRGR